MNTLKVGVVGCGEIAQIMHLPFLHELDGFEITAICDVSCTLLEKVGDRYGVERRYRNHTDMLREVDLDIVAILTMDHTQIAFDAAAAGAHLFIEKPLAFSVADAEAICAAAEAHGVKLMVGYMKLYDPGYLHAVEHFKRMPDIRLIRVQDFTGRWDIHKPLYSLVQATDIAADLGADLQRSLSETIHAAIGSTDQTREKLFRMLLMLCSHDLAVLRGAFGSPSRVLGAHAPSDDFLTAVLAYDDGPLVHFEAGTWTTYPWFQEEITAYGRDEIVTCQFPNPYVRYLPTRVVVRTQQDDKPVEMVWSPSNEEAFRNEWLHFRDCIENDTEPRTSGRDAVIDIQVAVDIIGQLNS